MALLFRWPSHAAVPWTLEAIRSALYPHHFVTAASDGFLTTVSDASLPCFCSLVSSDTLILFFIMVPLPFNISSNMTEVKYLSKYRCAPLGKDSAIQATAFLPIPSLWSVNLFRPLVNFKIQNQTTGTGKRKCFHSCGIWFPWHGLSYKTPACEGNHLLIYTSRPRPRQIEAALWRSVLQSITFFLLIRTIKIILSLMDCLILKNLSQLTELTTTGTLIFAANYIQIQGYRRHTLICQRRFSAPLKCF